jgi:hypothetical protein
VELKLPENHGMSLRRIDAGVGYAVNTVRSHLEADMRPRYSATTWNGSSSVLPTLPRKGFRNYASGNGVDY